MIKPVTLSCCVWLVSDGLLNKIVKIALFRIAYLMNEALFFQKSFVGSFKTLWKYICENLKCTE